MNSSKVLLERSLYYCSRAIATNFASKLYGSTMADVTGKVLLSKRDGVLTFTLSNEKLWNAVDVDTFNVIPRQLNLAANDESIKFVVFTGKGDYYTSGIDFNCLAAMFDGVEFDANRVGQLIEAIRKTVAAFIDFPKPIIAAVNGPVTGVFTAVLALKDYAVCSDTAYFQTPWTTHGVGAEACPSVTFPAIFGNSRASSMLMFGEKISAKDALNCGFVSKIFAKTNFEKDVEELIYGDRGILNSYNYRTILATKAMIKNEEWRRKMHAVNNAELDAFYKLWRDSELFRLVRKFYAKNQSVRLQSTQSN